MKQIQEIRSALKNELYNCALALALTLPDICGIVEYPNEESAGVRYKEWFKQYAEPLFTGIAEIPSTAEQILHTSFSSEEC